MAAGRQWQDRLAKSGILPSEYERARGGPSPHYAIGPRFHQFLPEDYHLAFPTSAVGSITRIRKSAGLDEFDVLPSTDGLSEIRPGTRPAAGP